MMADLFVIRSVVVLLAILVTGLLAGVMLGVAMEQQTAQKLPEAAWTFRQQNDDALFRKVMPFTFIAMMLLLIASIFFLHGRPRMAMVAATVAALAVIIVTAGWEVPINNGIVKWIPGHAPCRLDKYPRQVASEPLDKNLDRCAGIWMCASQHPTDQRLVRGESGPKDCCRLNHDKDKMTAELSRDMSERVGLARTLVLNPKLLLTDESTSGLAQTRDGLEPAACCRSTTLPS
jgi:hypothetical protein